MLPVLFAVLIVLLFGRIWIEERRNRRRREADFEGFCADVRRAADARARMDAMGDEVEQGVFADRRWAA